MDDELDAIVRGRPVDVPGVAIGVAIDGRTRWVIDGVTDVADARPVDSSTLFPLGSVTKTYTATAALALVDRGDLSLDTLVARVLGRVDFGAAATTLTVRHLLTHRGGWQGDWALFNAPTTRDARALGELTAQAPFVPRYGAPGAPFSYDNFGYCVLGAVIEAATGRPYDEAVTALVLEPLGLDNTVFRAADAPGRPIAAGHTAAAASSGVRGAEGTQPWADDWPVRRALWPTGGVVGTPADTMRWAAFHLDSATVGTSPISDSTRRAMQQPQGASGGQGVEVALGWHVRYASGVRVLSHTGVAQGLFAHVCIVPERAAAMVMLTNGANGPAVTEPAYRWLVERRLGLTVDLPPIVAPPQDSAALAGTYRTVTRTIRLRVGETGGLVAEIDDTGPTWGGTRTEALRFVRGDRLAGAGDPTLRMEFGTFDDGRRWVRYRGRIHVPAAEA